MNVFVFASIKKSLRLLSLFTILQMWPDQQLAQGPYVVAKVGFEPATFQTQSTEPHH